VKIRPVIAVMFLLAASIAAASAQDAASTYKAKCQMCHGADGKGATPMGQKMAVRDFKSPEAAKESDAEWITITKKGKNKMPAYDGKLTDDQIKDVVKFIRSM